MSILQEVHSEVRVWVWPLDPDAAFRSPCAVSDSYAGLVLPDRGESARDDGAAPDPFKAIEWQGQDLIKEPYGPLEWLRFLPDGTVARGVREAEQSEPQHELCGWSLRPLLERIHCDIVDPATPPGSPDYDLRPRLPEGEAVIQCQSQQGEKWERVIPIRSPLWAGLHHRSAPANRAVKVKTKSNWGKNEGVGWVLDCGGVAFGHDSEPAVRLEWGNSWSLVFRGLGKDARPRLERKGAGKDGLLQWRAVRTFDGAAPLDEKWWKARHSIWVYRAGHLLVVEIDGQTWWVADIAKGKTRPATWRASPLRVSIFGADIVLQVARLSFDREAGFKREVPVAAPPSSEVEFLCQGARMTRVPVPGIDANISTGIAFVDAFINALTATGKATMAGFDLGSSTLDGRWYEEDEGIGRVDYAVKLKGTVSDAPLLSDFAAQFPPTATTPLPDPINVRAALSFVEVETGEPERMPTGKATFALSVLLAQRMIARWNEIKDVLPFRRVRIECDENNDGNWQPIFAGRLFPDSLSSEGWNAQTINATCYDRSCELKAPAALVDGRFGALDLDVDYYERGTALYGGQCVQKLLGYEMRDAAATLNGNGNWKRYFPENHYPLRSQTDTDSYYASGAEEINGLLLPPPFGDDLWKWIGDIGKFDHAVHFYDSMESTDGAFFYGQIKRIYAERGQTVHALNESSKGVEAQEDKRLSAWPILSSYSSQGLLDKAFTRVQVWGTGRGQEGYRPSIFVGAATTPLPASDPLSELQSYPRTLLSRQEFINGRVQGEYAQTLAQDIWSEFEGRTPSRWDFTLRDQIKIVKWGEKIEWKGQELRALSSTLRWDFGENGGRKTTVTARSLSATGI